MDFLNNQCNIFHFQRVRAELRVYTVPRVRRIKTISFSFSLSPTVFILRPFVCEPVPGQNSTPIVLKLYHTVCLIQE